MICQKCKRVIEDGPTYYIRTNDPPTKEICSICFYHYNLLMCDIVNNPRPKSMTDMTLMEYTRQRLTDWFDTPDEKIYFMVLNNSHHNEASMTPLGLHRTDDTAIESADACIERMDLGHGWNHKIFRIEDGGKIRELDISDEFSPPIEVLSPGEISWIFDEPCGH